MSDFLNGIDQIPTDTKPTDQVKDPTAKPEYKMIGDGKKYKSVEDADVGLFNANEHIRRLEEELAIVKPKAIQAETYAQVIEKLNLNPASTDAAATTPPPVDTAKPTLSPNEMESIAKKVFSSQALEAKREENRLSVLTKLKQVYGTREKITEVLAEKAEQFQGIDLQELARSSPEAALALLVEPRTKVASAAFTPNSTRAGTPMTRGNQEMAGYEGQGILDFTKDPNFAALKGGERGKYIEEKLRESGQIR